MSIQATIKRKPFKTKQLNFLFYFSNIIQICDLIFLMGLEQVKDSKKTQIILMSYFIKFLITVSNPLMALSIIYVVMLDFKI